MRRNNTISLSPLVCALGIMAVVAVMPFFVSAASPNELPNACPGTLSDYNVIEGTEGDDQLEGTDDPDYILGYGGNDVIDGDGGTDCIVAGAGFDTIVKPSEDVYFLNEPPAEDADGETEEDDQNAQDESTGRFSTACVTFGNVVPVGRQVTFAAGHFGGQGEVTYRWLGAIVGEGQFQRPTFTTTGPKLITVVATDEEGRIATAGCPVLAQAGLGAPVFTPTPSGVGGAPGEGTGTGAVPGTVTPPAQSGTGTGDTDGEDAETPEDLIDGEEVDIDGQSGTNTGRVVLWVLIALIIISLGVLFWQRYYQDEDEGTLAKPTERKEVKKEEKKETKKEDTNKKDSGDSQEGGGGTVIIPPAK